MAHVFPDRPLVLGRLFFELVDDDLRDRHLARVEPETERFFPSSRISKFACVSPRIGLPARSTTVTGTSTYWTVMLSLTCADTLAAAKSLDYLLYPDLPVVIPDAVLYEATAAGERSATRCRRS